ncbi:FAD-dependent oxidoreductase [Williamsia phyllosphaerae]|uniref:Pentachlorophenol monooxygenase n=1 Tax=Williamsia phyllosphaerae TaxID=885042 RepID=A0ABQ1UW87_9NOCA|nr:FAD-dependent oxidoreductase [Williamsia phyllosphaerae]GGF26623.1 pentachlorophenol monooxygenase [Williamsia phyllosphaerae]
MLTSASSVLVVGGGPTGLSAAVALAGRGIGVRVIDAAAQGANTSRAAVVHPRTLEVLEDIDVTRRILDRAVRVPRFDIRDGSRSIARLDFSSLKTDYPFTAMISQADTETILRDRLAELGVEVEWNTRLEGLDADGRAQVVTATGRSSSVRSDVVVGADGMHSAVRDAVGIAFPGTGYEQSFVLADVAMEWPVPRDTVSLTFAPEGLAVVAPLPDDRFRVVATADDPPTEPDSDYIGSLLRRRAGSAHVSDVAWSGRFRIHHRLAETYRRGAVFLVGDAAHVHSPAGGQGMNTGIQDALALAGILADGGDPDSYERLRRPVARRVLRLTDRMTRAATVDLGGARFVRNTLIRAGLALPPVRHRISMEISELAYR